MALAILGHGGVIEIAVLRNALGQFSEAELGQPVQRGMDDALAFSPIATACVGIGKELI